MALLSTEQVAKKLGISKSALSRYILTGKIEAPPETMAGGIKLRLWTEEEIERLRQALPKIANGRKTRYQKLRDKNAPAGVPVPHKPGSTKEKMQAGASQPQHAKTARVGGPKTALQKKQKTKKKK